MDPLEKTSVGKVNAAEFPVFWTRLGRLLGKLMTTHAHAEVVVTVQDGVIKYVKVNQGFLPGNVPPV